MKNTIPKTINGPTIVAILIGPQGSGKTTLARAIRASFMRHRRRGTIVAKTVIFIEEQSEAVRETRGIRFEDATASC